MAEKLSFSEIQTKFKLPLIGFFHPEDEVTIYTEKDFSPSIWSILILANNTDYYGTYESDDGTFHVRLSKSFDYLHIYSFNNTYLIFKSQGEEK